MSAYGTGDLKIGVPVSPFADANAEVAITGTRAAVDDYGHDLDGFTYHALDVRDAAAIARLAGSLSALDVLVNNAGASFAFEPSEWDPAVFEDSVRVNLFGAFRLAVACRPLLTASALDGGASIVNVASMAARCPAARSTDPPVCAAAPAMGNRAYANDTISFPNRCTQLVSAATAVVQPAAFLVSNGHSARDADDATVSAAFPGLSGANDAGSAIPASTGAANDHFGSDIALPRCNKSFPLKKCRPFVV